MSWPYGLVVQARSHASAPLPNVTAPSLSPAAPARYVTGVMQPPRRLHAKRFPLLRRPAEPPEEGWNALTLPSNHMIVRRSRAVTRGLWIALWTLLSMPVQALLIALPGRGKVWFARVYWSTMCRLLGLRVRVIGPRLRRRAAGGRPVVYVSNHSSWLDILVLGGRLEACFIAKEEVAGWPLVSWIAKLGRTVYVRRKRTSIAGERDDMRDRLAAGDNLILFPEGTTSDGSRVLPFRSAFLSIAELPVTPDGQTAARAAGVGRLRPARRTCRPGAPPGRCSPGTATWTSARISGASPNTAACARPCCCTRRSTRRISRAARRWRRRPGAPSRTVPRCCGRTGRPGR